MLFRSEKMPENEAAMKTAAAVAVASIEENHPVSTRLMLQYFNSSPDLGHIFHEPVNVLCFKNDFHAAAALFSDAFYDSHAKSEIVIVNNGHEHVQRWLPGKESDPLYVTKQLLRRGACLVDKSNVLSQS